MVCTSINTYCELTPRQYYKVINRIKERNENFFQCMYELKRFEQYLQDHQTLNAIKDFWNKVGLSLNP